MLDPKDFLSYEELKASIEKDNSNSNIKTAANFLLDATRDYPKFNLKAPFDLLTELKQDLKAKALTYDNLKTFSEDTANEAWKIEAVASLLEMFDLERTGEIERTIELDTIIRCITEHYRKMFGVNSD